MHYRYLTAFIYPITATIKSLLAKKGHAQADVAQEFNPTKPTISDSVKVLLLKKSIRKVDIIFSNNEGNFQYRSHSIFHFALIESTT